MRPIGHWGGKLESRYRESVTAGTPLSKGEGHPMRVPAVMAVKVRQFASARSSECVRVTALTVLVLTRRTSRAW